MMDVIDFHVLDGMELLVVLMFSSFKWMVLALKIPRVNALDVDGLEMRVEVSLTWSKLHLPDEIVEIVLYHNVKFVQIARLIKQIVTDTFHT